MLDGDRLLVQSLGVDEAGERPLPATLEIDGHRLTARPDCLGFGRCPARTFFAVATVDGIFPGKGIAPNADAVFDGVPGSFRLHPFADGERLVPAGSQGIWLLREGGPLLLHPREAELNGGTDDEDPLELAHADISPGGDLILLGSQRDGHLLFDAEIKALCRPKLKSSTRNAYTIGNSSHRGIRRLLFITKPNRCIGEFGRNPLVRTRRGIASLARARRSLIRSRRSRP